MKNKIINKNELNKHNVYISIKKYCEFSGTSKITVARQIKNGKFPYQIVKIKSMGKKRFIIIKKGFFFLDKNNNLIIIKD